ncbi:MAG: hypothetical protein GF353_18840 [Candidatus Lokiarchaeota archaeon]|nr:hypothetical protein [Candidatus Lokiarchaeota archaeon]
MEDTLAILDDLKNKMQKKESEIFSMAFQTGVKQLWREHVLGQYLRGKITRDEAIESVGIDWVELAERQHKATMEDLSWAMNL